jgi:sec-independent protein translocase protein TatA
MNFGGSEMLLIAVVVFLLFGATRLPQLAKAFGQSKKAFKKGFSEADEEERAATKSLPVQRPTPQIAHLSDEAIMAEIRRRSESRI